MLTTVAKFREPWEAHMLRGRLQAEGIPALVAFEFHVWQNWLYSNAIGGVHVLVPQELNADARAVEGRCRIGDFAADLEIMFGKLDRLHCPKCGSDNFKRKRTVLQLLASAGFAWFFSAPPPIGYICHCKACGAKLSEAAA